MYMERKYQVFISSTYEDLKTERQAAISCLLDLNCIPVGMEQFPASSLSQWEYIKTPVELRAPMDPPYPRTSSAIFPFWRKWLSMPCFSTGTPNICEADAQ